MKFVNSLISFSEVPKEVSLCLSISGCPNNCLGCHSPELREEIGKVLSKAELRKQIDKNKLMITCVTFLGGDQYSNLEELLEVCLESGLETCLYTGKTEVRKSIETRLTYLKTGNYIQSLGGLTSKTTNQKFTNIKTGENLNRLFWKEGKSVNDKTNTRTA